MNADCQCFRCTKERVAVDPGEMLFGRPVALMRMFLCSACGNKRCPHATDHRHPCTGSNAPGQPGSLYETPVAADALAPPSARLGEGLGVPQEAIQPSDTLRGKGTTAFLAPKPLSDGGRGS